MAIHYNLTYAEYEALPGIRSSQLKHFLVSKLRGMYMMQNKQEETAALRIGKAIHCLVLEGRDVFNDRYVIGGPVNPRTGSTYGRDTKAFKEWLAEQAPGIEVLSNQDFNLIQKMNKSLTGSADVQEALKNNPHRETAFTWVDPVTGVECKALLDAFGRDVLDMKSFRKPLLEDNISREMHQREYHIQFPFYWDGAKANGINPESFLAVFIQNTDEMDCAVIEVGYSTLDYGREYYQRALQAYKEAKAGDITGSLPGRTTVDIPYWVIESDFDYGNIKFEEVGAE
jgi:uncharacterized protein YidB (DUF937 family)